MRKGLKNLIIGALILGSFCTQAGRTALVGRSFSPSTAPFKSYKYVRSDDDLLHIKYGNNRYTRREQFMNDYPLFGEAFDIVYGKDYGLDTLEAHIIYDIFHHHKVQIVLSEEWNSSGAKEKIIKFLKEFIDLKHLPLSKAFDIALMRVGKAIPTNVNSTAARIMEHINEGTLIEFFGESNAITVSETLEHTFKRIKQTETKKDMK